MIMCLLMVNLKSLFRHLDATLPKYQLRAFGCDVPIGAIYSINPAMIVVLVPIIGALTTGRLSDFDMIHCGSWLSALSPLFIVAVPTLWSTAAFVALLSLGEAVWSPRWLSYAISIPPDGKEGIFTALMSAPLFLAMLPTGMISGALLQHYCPGDGSCGGSASASGEGSSSNYEAAAAEEGTCDGRSLWGVVSVIGLASPLLILICQRWVKPAPGDFQALEEHVYSLEAGEGEMLPLLIAADGEAAEEEASSSGG